MSAANAPRFVRIGADCKPTDGDWVAVLDNQTKLIWTRDDVAGGRMSWKKAAAAATDVRLCGWDDWRLPTRAELLSLVDDTRYAPATDTEFFPDCKSEWYWSSTPYAASPGGCAWIVHFDDGNSYWNYQSGVYLVRAVRASQYSAIGDTDASAAYIAEHKDADQAAADLAETMAAGDRREPQS